MRSRRANALRAAGQRVEVTLFVGRGGLTDAVAAEAAAQLRTHDLLKARISRDAADAKDRREIAAQLASRAGAELVEVRGLTVLLAKRRPARGK